MTEVGERVGAILGSNHEEKTIEFLGYGTYVGDEFPYSAVGLTAEAAKEVGESTGQQFKNPKIELDDGTVVWGCECWWGGADGMREALNKWVKQGYTIQHVNMEEVREEYRKEREEKNNETNG